MGNPMYYPFYLKMQQWHLERKAAFDQSPSCPTNCSNTSAAVPTVTPYNEFRRQYQATVCTELFSCQRPPI